MLQFFNSERKALLTLLIVFIAVIITLQYKLYLAGSKKAVKQAVQKIDLSKYPPGKAKEAINSGVSRNEVKYGIENSYELTLERKPGSPDPKYDYFPLYLTQFLRIPDEYRFTDSGFPFMYDSEKDLTIVQTGDSGKTKQQLYDRKYYLLLPKAEFGLENNYENDAFIARLKRPDPEIIPYLNNNKYCNNDNDCYAGNNFCAVGAFNYFNILPFGPYGCGGMTDMDFIKLDGNYYTSVDGLNSGLGCPTVVTYNSARCINNRCKAFGRKVTCSP